MRDPLRLGRVFEKGPQQQVTKTELRHSSDRIPFEPTAGSSGMNL